MSSLVAQFALNIGLDGHVRRVGTLHNRITVWISFWFPFGISLLLRVSFFSSFFESKIHSRFNVTFDISALIKSRVYWSLHCSNLIPLYHRALTNAGFSASDCFIESFIIASSSFISTPLFTY